MTLNRKASLVVTRSGTLSRTVGRTPTSFWTSRGVPGGLLSFWTCPQRWRSEGEAETSFPLVVQRHLGRQCSFMTFWSYKVLRTILTRQNDWSIADEYKYFMYISVVGSRDLLGQINCLRHITWARVVTVYRQESEERGKRFVFYL